MNILIWCIIGTILFTVLVGFALGDSWDKEDSIIGTLSFLIPISLFVILTFTGREINVKKYPKYVGSNKIVSVQGNQTIKGRFGGGLFVFSGSIDGIAKYFYYQDNGNGGYVLKNIDASNAVIYQDEDVNPYINTFKEYRNGNKFWMIEEGEVPNGNVIIDFHIPKGSIIQEFNLDAK